MKHSWNMQLLRIADKGWAAFEAGQSVDDCPYKDALTGVQRQRADHWRQGWHLAKMKAEAPKYSMSVATVLDTQPGKILGHQTDGMVLDDLGGVTVVTMPAACALIGRNENGEIDPKYCGVIKNVKA